MRFVWSVRDRATIQSLFSRDFVESKKQQQQLQGACPAPYLPDLLLSLATNEARDVFVTEFFLMKGTQESENPVDQQLQHYLCYNTRPRIRETLQSVGETQRLATRAELRCWSAGHR